jgi:hypothetical protein
MAVDAQQLKEFAELYRGFGDEELESLAATMGDLTETAQQALKTEFSHRNLALPAVQAVSVPVDTVEAESALHGFAANAPQECTFEFTDMEDALLAQSVLRSAGIESVVPTSEIGAIDTPRLIVGPLDAQSAELILSRPDAQGATSSEDALFPMSVCPKCGAPDPLLESVEPTNRWRCEACSHTWQDADPS